MSKNSPIDRIELLIDYVEERIEAPLKLDELSERAGLSKYHLDRIFRAATGKQLMDYVRNRKLSRSVARLLESGSKVIDVAMEYGFAYEQSYIRAFRRAFGVSPDRFRRQKTEIPMTEKLDLRRLEAIGEAGMILEPSIRLRPSFSIVGEPVEMSVEVNNETRDANRLGNDFFFNKKCRVRGVVRPEVYIGYMRLFPDDLDRVVYMPSAMIEPGAATAGLPEGMVRVDLPTRTYAVFTYIGLFHARHVAVNEFRHVYEHVYGAWLPASRYRPAGDFRFESIDERIAREDYCEVELYIPIEER
jgi:AraC family transcriptional regulator